MNAWTIDPCTGSRRKVDSVGLSNAIFGVVCSTIIHINNTATTPHRHHLLPLPLLILTPLTSAL